MKNISARESARRIEASRRRNDKHTPKFADGKPFDTFVEDVVEEIQTDGEGAVLLAKLQCFIAKKLVEAGVTEDNMPTRQRDVLEKAVGSAVMDIWGDVWPGGAGLEELAGVPMKTASKKPRKKPTAGGELGVLHDAISGKKPALDNDDNDDEGEEDSEDCEDDGCEAVPANVNIERHRVEFVSAMRSITLQFRDLKGIPPYSYTKSDLLKKVVSNWPDSDTEFAGDTSVLDAFLKATRMDSTTGDGLPGWTLVWNGNKVTFCVKQPAVKGVRGKSGKGKKK